MTPKKKKSLDPKQKAVPQLSKEDLRDIKKLTVLMDKADGHAWEGAFLAQTIVEDRNIRQQVIADKMGRDKTSISSWLKAAKVGRALEADGVEYKLKLGVYKAATIERNYGQLPAPEKKRNTLSEFAVEAMDKSARQVRRGIADRGMKRAYAENAKAVAGTIRSIQDRSHNMGSIKWMKAEAKKSPHQFRVLYGDTPYSYKDVDRLPIDHCQVTGLRTDCDSSTFEESIKLTCDIILNAEPLLCKNDDARGGGVLIIMQAGGQEVLPRILAAVDKAKLTIRYTVAIDTGQSKLGNPAHPYGRSSETMLIITRKGDDLIRCDTSRDPNELNGGNLLGADTSIVTEEDIREYTAQWEESHEKKLWRFNPTGKIRANASRQNKTAQATEGAAYGDCHMFQKSEPQLLFVLSKHCIRGDKIADLCGCSASCCIAADQMGLNWEYIESHKGNFNWGLSRIQKYMDETGTTEVVESDSTTEKPKKATKATKLKTQDVFDDEAA